MYSTGTGCQEGGGGEYCGVADVELVWELPGGGGCLVNAARWLSRGRSGCLSEAEGGRNWEFLVVREWVFLCRRRQKRERRRRRVRAARLPRTPPAMAPALLLGFCFWGWGGGFVVVEVVRARVAVREPVGACRPR